MHAYSCHPKIPVVYIPANAEQAAHADPDHGLVLTKPFSGVELVAAVKRLLLVPSIDNCISAISSGGDHLFTIANLMRTLFHWRAITRVEPSSAVTSMCSEATGVAAGV